MQYIYEVADEIMKTDPSSTYTLKNMLSQHLLVNLTFNYKETARNTLN